MRETENEKKLRIALGKCTRQESANSCNSRLDKDIFYYKKEEQQEKEKIEKMISENADEYDIRQLVGKQRMVIDSIEACAFGDTAHDS